MGWLDIFRSKPAPTPIREVAPTARQIAAVRLQENVNNYPDFFDSLMDRYWSNGQWWFPIDGIPSIGGAQNKTRGLDRYVFNTDQQLRLQRDAARILYAREPVAKTIEGHLNAFVIGKGFKYTVKPKKDYQEQITPEQLRQYQEYFDQWSDAEQWPEREQECYTSKFVDGEFFLRVTVYKGAVRTRRLEPEHIQDPPGMSFVDGWFLGVKFAPDDMETPLAYGYKVEGKEWEEIPAKEVIHYKANVTRNVSRGISDLYPVLDDVKSIAQLSDNVREGAAARAEIAYMWSIKNATPAAVSRFADEQKDRSSYNSLTLKTDRSKGMKSGKAVAHGDNVEYTTMPQGDVEGSIAALQAALRMVGGRWCLPEYMTSADASNGNYASTQVAGGPFVRFVEREQNLLKRPFKQVYDLVMKQAVVTGVIPTSEYAKLDIQIDCDSPVIEDKYQQAQMYEIERRNGVLSPQQWCAMAGRDYEDTQRDINEWNESNMQAAPAMGGTGAGGLFGGQQQGDGGQADDNSDGGQPAQSQVKESWDENKHPRDNIGQFASKGGDSGGSKDKSQGKPKRGEFGYGSKAVDSKGRLLELYHGSEHDFDEFKITGNSDGLFFSVNKPTAGDRTGESRDEWKHQYTVHLDIKNPIQVSSKILIDPDADDPWQAYVDNENSVMQDAKEQGYDGMRIDDNVWIAFSPSQVKLIKKEAL